MATALIERFRSYRIRMFIYLMSIFAVFTLLLVIFQYHREQLYRENILESRLRGYADIVAGTLEAEGLEHDSVRLHRIVRIFPEDLRITVITRSGKVMYESERMEASEMGSHLNRPEILNSINHIEGNDIRNSVTTGVTYFYYAKSYGSFIVRMALPYDNSVKDLMKADYIFIWFVLALFPIALILIIYLINHFGKSVTMLRHFINSAENGLIDYDKMDFPHTELGELSRNILMKYKELEESNRLIANERERLLRHFHYFEEGVAIFSPTRQKIYANPIFLQYINTILDRPTADINTIWKHQPFAPATEFLNLNSSVRSGTEEAPIFRFTISAGSTFFAVQLLIYNDSSFEMTLCDITRAEKNRLLKQQMSNNITHELRTPVSSISGYLETILNCPNLTEERKHYFMERAYIQVQRLTDLIRDVSLISKTEEAPDTMPLETINVCQLVDDIVEELRPKIQEAQMHIENHVPSDTVLKGNYSLVYSIFRNLMENSLRYAGPESILHAECYNQDDKYCYFRYYDTGRGVEECHLSRLFERFYRVSEGRTRDCGGTGLGLSIVRNAVLFHQGNINVRNRKEGGLEFLFTLKK